MFTLLTEFRATTRLVIWLGPNFDIMNLKIILKRMKTYDQNFSWNVGKNELTLIDSFQWLWGYTMTSIDIQWWPLYSLIGWCSDAGGQYEKEEDGM